MAAAAVLSIGPASDLDSCLVDVLNFLRVLSWRGVCVDVKRWRIKGLLREVRRWESVAASRERLAQEIAQFIVWADIIKTATVLVQH
jgi:hypothetical protein